MTKRKWTYEIPKKKGWYWIKEESLIIAPADEEQEKIDITYLEDIIYFDGVHFNPGNELNECGPEDALFEELYGDCQWYGPIEPPE